MNFDPVSIAIYIVALLPTIVLHELSHGIAADRMGDQTPRAMGRLTLNPIKHIDPFGTVILPGLLLLPALFGRPLGVVFGYAKPMPFNPSNLKDPDRQTMWIALWGPATNLLLAIVGAVGLRLVSAEGARALAVLGPGAETLIGREFGIVAQLMATLLSLNVIFAVFNIFPIPPLDGSKVLARFLPPRAREVFRSWEPYGALFLLVLFFMFQGPVFAIFAPIVSGLLGLLVG